MINMPGLLRVDQRKEENKSAGLCGEEVGGVGAAPQTKWCYPVVDTYLVAPTLLTSFPVIPFLFSLLKFPRADPVALHSACLAMTT